MATTNAAAASTSVTDAEIAQAQRERGWTPMRTSVAVRKFALGWTDSQIAALIGGCTRNAVIGIRNRANIRAGHLATRPRFSVAAPPTAREPKPRLVKSRTQAAISPPAIDDASIPIEQRRSLMDLTKRCCHWPVGEPDQPGFFFCGAVAQERDDKLGPYCASHMRRAHAPPRAAHRPGV